VLVLRPLSTVVIIVEAALTYVSVRAASAL
jgi:hypothetical protein